MSTELDDASSSMLKSKKFKELLQHSTDTMAIGAAEVWLQERLKTFVQLSGHPGGRMMICKHDNCLNLVDFD